MALIVMIIIMVWFRDRVNVVGFARRGRLLRLFNTLGLDVLGVVRLVSVC